MRAIDSLAARDVFQWLYVDDDGVVRWKKQPRGRTPVGSPAGEKTKYGYIRINVAGKNCFAHRIVWLLTYGVWPSEELDHINGDKTDNRPSNLREISRRGNCQNMELHRKGRLPGAHPRYKKWQSQIKIGGKWTYLGLYKTEQEASAAYFAAAENCDGATP